MQYRKLGKLGMETSILGFGCMRLPTRDTSTDSPDIDRVSFRALAQYALDEGINYFDTAYSYHSGQSEIALGEIFSELPRKEVRLVTKMPIWMVKEQKDFDRFFHEQLSRLQTDYLDGYLLHNLTLETYRKLCTLGIREWLEAQKERGRILFSGFSFHETPEAFKEIIDDWTGWDLCQVQYNYMNEDTQAGNQGVTYAHEKGLAVVVMEPLLGGNLAAPPQSVCDIFEQASKKWTPAEWAFSWLWNQPEISTVLSGMNSMSQLQENISIANHAEPGFLAKEEVTLIKKARDKFKSLWPISCTGCGYCLPCPSGVAIPRIFELFNHAEVHSLFILNRNIYNAVVPPESRANMCQECGRCEERCPQGLSIISHLSRIHTYFTE